MVGEASGCRKPPEVTSIIVDQGNRKSLLLFMVHIRQHLFNALMSRLSAFLPSTGTGKRSRAVRFAPSHALRERTGIEMPPWTGGYPAENNSQGYLDGPEPRSTTT
jgi:hypothetical protein